MELAFADRGFRDICLSDSLAKQSLDELLTEKLKARLADMAAASVVSELIAGEPRELNGDRWDHMAVSLINNFQLTFRSGHSHPRLLDSDKVDWSHVSRIYIIGMEKSDE